MTKRVSALTGPIAILAVSAIIGTIVISIVLAMTSLYDIAI
jgi:type II secretory pathway component PulF